MKNFFAFVGTQWFITIFTTVRHKSLFWTRSIQSTPSILISLRSILILFTHKRLRLQVISFPQVSQPNPLFAVLSSPMRLKFPTLLVILGLITQILLPWATELLLGVWFQSLDSDTQNFGHLYEPLNYRIFIRSDVEGCTFYGKFIVREVVKKVSAFWKICTRIWHFALSWVGAIHVLGNSSCKTLLRIREPFLLRKQKCSLSLHNSSEIKVLRPT